MSEKIAELRAQLGKCFYTGFEGLDLPNSTAKFINENSIGGITLFANNYDSPAQLAELINEVQAHRNGELPLAICVDHEGGKVQRFREPFTRFPDARLIGDQDSPRLAFECAELMGHELKAVGINVNFAPVADIATRPDNPVIGPRAFGDNEERVSKMVSAFVRGFVTSGIQCVVKHFPGHGDTTEDSHFHLPQITTTKKTLLDREIKPFLKGFRSHCNLVMTAHIIVKDIDPDMPATLSPKILTELLRGQLRYRGLVITDDMEMKAITDHFGELEAPLRALEAGANILLYHTESASTRVFEGLLSKLTSPEGAAARANLLSSATKVDEFRAKAFGSYKPIYIPEITQVLGSDRHLELANRIAKLNSKQLS